MDKADISIMPEREMKAILNARAKEMDEFLDSWPFKEMEVPHRLKEAMRYSLNAGGKRIRPVLCMTWAAVCGMDPRYVVPFGAAIEMIHTYSLIHDDLPAMDNDDLRRGKPSSHKAFDEATAILAGDGLLTDSFWLMSKLPFPAETLLSAIGEVAFCAGSSGMVGGQMLDMIYTGKGNITKEELSSMEALKTGKMFRASCTCGVILAGGTGQMREQAMRYGAYLGWAFQIADDILDITGDTLTMGKPAGSDYKSGKLTWPALIGMAECRKLAISMSEKAKKALRNMIGQEPEFLRSLADYVVQRTL